MAFQIDSNLHEGMTGPGVAELQNYLARYGYLNLSKVEPGIFNEEMTRALVAYQQFFGLQETGVLDEITILAMEAPRCGVPDLGLKEKYRNIFSGIWLKRELTFQINLNGIPGGLIADDVQNAIVQAFRVWSDVASFAAYQVNSGADIEISFQIGDHGNGNPLETPFDGSLGVLAHAFPPPLGFPNERLAGDIHFDAAETWSITIPTPVSSFDLLTLAIHEIGHSLGLEHSSVPAAIMRPTFSPGSFQHTLDSDDITNITSLYGRRQPQLSFLTARPDPNTTIASASRNSGYLAFKEELDYA